MTNGSGQRGRFLIPVLVLAAALFFAGCSVTYIPVSWGIGDRVKEIAGRDELLKVLFARYNPDHSLLRVSGESFNEVLTPEEAEIRLGAYRLDKKLVYRNMDADLDDATLRNLMVHEVAHHVWFTAMSPGQRDEWIIHLMKNPAPWQRVVRWNYPNPASHDAEDFAYTLQFAREGDIEMLAYIGVIGGDEALRIIDAIPPEPGIEEWETLPRKTNAAGRSER